MLFVDTAFYIAFLVFSLISIVMLLVTARKISYTTYYSKLMLGVIFSIVLLNIVFIIFLFFLKQLFLLFVGLIISVVFLVVCLIKGASSFILEHTSSVNKETELMSEIKRLNERPNFKLEIMEKLFEMPQDWLKQMLHLFAKKNSFETILLPSILKKIMEMFNSDGAVFFSADAFDDSLKCKAYIGNFPPPYKLPVDVPHKEDIVKTNFKYFECNIGETVFGKVAKDACPYYISSYIDDGIVYQNGEEDFLKIGSIIVLPLFTNDSVSGIFAISRNVDKEDFTEEEFKNISNLSNYLSAIFSLVILQRDYDEASVLNNTANMAQELRQIILPKKLKITSKLDIDVYFRKQHGVCSDYYDVIQSHKDRIFIFSLDVAGKSIQSAIVMIIIRAILYLITNTNEKLETIIDWLNKGITEKVGIDLFATVSLLCYYPETSIVDFIAAGNQSMILYRAEKGEVEVFHHKTDPIGIDIHSKYKCLTFRLSKGDVISLYTDGIWSMLDKNGECFDINSLAKLIAEKSSEDASNIVCECRNLIDDFTSGTSLHDDQTLLVIKAK
ncbi:MAG: GAF domain-containing SpoIIE family protein phosphatase [Treponema sp.]